MALLATVVALLLLEGAVRVRAWILYGTPDRLHRMVVHAESGLKIPEPGRDFGAIRLDSRGFRNPELEVPKPEGRVRFAFVGASTTFCTEVSSNAATWPALVAAGLARAHPTADVDYVNAGVVGYLLAHIEKNLDVRVRPLAPDVVVLYEATNDLTKETRDQAIEQGVYHGHADEDDVLSRVSLLWHLVRKNLLARQRNAEAAEGRDRVRLDAARIEETYRARVRHAVEVARSVAPIVVVVTFSQRLRPGMSPEETRAACVTHAYYMPYMSAEGLIEGFEACNRAIRAAAAETGAILVEDEDSIPADAEHFADSVHFTDAGCRAQAERVLRALEGSPEVQRLLTRPTPAR